MNRTGNARCLAPIVVMLVWTFSVAGAQTPTPSGGPVAALGAYPAAPAEGRASLSAHAFATAPLTKAQAQEASTLLRREHARRIRLEREAEMKARRIHLDGKTMPFHYTVFGDAPPGGRSLYISLHGGGGAPPTAGGVSRPSARRNRGVF